MFNKKTSVIAALMVCVIIFGSLASCAVGESGDDTDTLTDTTETSEIAESEKDSEDVTKRPYDETVEIDYVGSDADIVELGSILSNKVQSYYDDGDKSLFIMENADTVIKYNMNDELYVRSVTDKSGNVYVENTMDVFVQMKDGNKYYASNSLISPSMNIYRLGYYYYENRIENQLFVGSDSGADGKNIKHYDMKQLVNIEQTALDKKTGIAYYRITAKRDPQLYLPGISFEADKYSYLEVTMKANNGVRENLELYIWAGNYEHYSSEQRITYDITVDGEFHTYIIPLSAVPDYTGKVKGIRLDVNGAEGSTFEIQSIRAISMGEGTPQDLSLQRSFLTYSDKVHHIAQISASRETKNIALVGVETKIPVDKIKGMVIKDKRWHY